MPRFLFEASYTVEGVKGLRRQGGSGRREAVATAAHSVGGRLEQFYFAFGDYDAIAVADSLTTPVPPRSRWPSVRQGVRPYAPWCS